MPRLSTSSMVSSDCQDEIDVGREFLQLYELTGYMNTCQASCSSHHLRGAHLISTLLVLVWEYLKQQTLLYDKKISTKTTAALKFREIQKGMLWKKTSWRSAWKPILLSAVMQLISLQGKFMCSQQNPKPAAVSLLFSPTNILIFFPSLHL